MYIPVRNIPSLDPTLIVSIVFPIFFGLILGDVGYGALLLAASFGLRKLLKGTEGKMLLDIMRNASIASIFLVFCSVNVSDSNYPGLLSFPPGISTLVVEKEVTGRQSLN
jgi:vacuolar-type H+-ATPase subunit I/STV1